MSIWEEYKIGKQITKKKDGKTYITKIDIVVKVFSTTMLPCPPILEEKKIEKKIQK